MARTCDFEQLADSLVRDQIVRCTNNVKVQENLLDENPDLKEMLSIVEGMENTSMWVQEMRVEKSNGDTLSDNCP